MDVEEVKSFFKVWASAMASLCYCYTVAASVPKGTARLISLFPVFYLLTVLPLGLTSSFHLAGPTAFLLVWLCNFKLLLFSFGAGPLSRTPSCLHFVLVASLPIRIKQDQCPGPSSSSTGDSGWSRKQHRTTPTTWASNICSESEGLGYLHNHGMALLAVKVSVLALLFQAYKYKPYLHPCIVWGLYCLHAYLELELVLAIYAVPARVVLGGLGLELEPQFKEPYLTTSLEDFWGRRWNLAVSGILRMTVYDPLRGVCIPVLDPELSSYAAVFSTFTVSGLMHEALFYYYTRASPTWEVTAFFLIQGACVVAEKAAKRRFGKTWQPHGVVSGALTLGFLSATAIPLFGLPLTRHGMDEKAIKECHDMASFVAEKARLVSGLVGRELRMVSKLNKSP